MIAAQDLVKDDVLLADYPYCWIVDESSKEFVCQTCFLEKDDIMEAYIGCGDCNQVFYCSEECRNLDYVQHSQDECAILKALEMGEYSPLIITEMKLLIRTLSRKSVESIADENNNPNMITGDNGLRYVDYIQLITNRENFPQSTIESLDYWICDYIRRLGEWVGGRTETNVELLDIILRNRCNAFYIQGRITQAAAEKGVAGQSRGCGIYVRNSFFNHSCSPNVNYWVVGDSLKVECTASGPVKNREELFISYIDTNQNLEQRRAKLKESYLFDCDCVKCAAEEKGEIFVNGEEVVVVNPDTSVTDEVVGQDTNVTEEEDPNTEVEVEDPDNI